MRVTQFPAKSVCEVIRTLSEWAKTPTTPGIVKVGVSFATEEGEPLEGPIQAYTIEGADYDELVGPAQPWAPDKPEGTYRNEDLWHFIDKQRAEAAKPKDEAAK